MEEFVTTAIMKVRDFHQVFGHPVDVGFKDNTVDRKLLKQRIALINEEARELSEALGNRPFEIALSNIELTKPFDSFSPLNQAVDALGDLMYVIAGTFVAFGISPPTTFSFGNIPIGGIPSIDPDICTISDVISYSNDCLLTVLKLSRTLFVRSKGNMENFYRIFNIIHENNMSKLCSSEEAGKRTVERYTTQNIKASFRPSLVPGKFAVYNVETQKILKSIDWVEPDLETVLNDIF